jgi:REP element-mobilizing transposase RayT
MVKGCGFVGRMPRIEFEGALYHVIQRGNNREFIFNRNSDKNYLLKRLVDGKKQLDFNLTIPPGSPRPERSEGRGLPGGIV